MANNFFANVLNSIKVEKYKYLAEMNCTDKEPKIEGLHAKNVYLLSGFRFIVFIGVFFKIVTMVNIK